MNAPLQERNQAACDKGLKEAVLKSAKPALWVTCAFIKILVAGLASLPTIVGLVIEFLPDATFVIDEKSRVVAWNRAMEEISGVLKTEILLKGNFEYSLAL